MPRTRLLPLHREGVLLARPHAPAKRFTPGEQEVPLGDRALEFRVDHCAIDGNRVAIEGFSDGASYALSLGLTNGDLFRWIFAFSPGFMAPYTLRGRPQVYVTHGLFDPTLPVRCSRENIVPKLRGNGYEVEYREFKGFHMVPGWAIRRAAEKLAA